MMINLKKLKREFAIVFRSFDTELQNTIYEFNKYVETREYFFVKIFQGFVKETIPALMEDIVSLLLVLMVNNRVTYVNESYKVY